MVDSGNGSAGEAMIAIILCVVALTILYNVVI